MSDLLIVVYGFIQGLCEFLPVSSSGHLALLPSFMSVKDPGVIFDLLMHLGTSISIVLYFKKEIMRIIKEGILILKNRTLKDSWFFVNFFIATIFSVIFILLLKDFSESVGRSSKLIAFNLIFFGLIMWICDLRRKNNISMDEKGNLFKAIIIGIFQSFAIFPGVSRSGITLSAARLMKLSREEASRFSFLMSLPIIIASILYKLPSIVSGEATYVPLGQILMGVGVSFVVGILTIHFFLKFIKRIGLLPFTIYRLIIGVLVFYFV